MNKFIKASKNKVFNLKMQKSVFYYWFKYHQLFFHSLIWRGRKLFAFNFFIKVKQELKLREESDPSLVLFVALLKITPEVILFPQRRAGVVHMVPMPITIKKQITYSIK
jgi:ribosomal protein S7